MADLIEEVLNTRYGGKPPLDVEGLNIPLQNIVELEKYFDGIAHSVAESLNINEVSVRFSGSTNIGALVHPLDNEKYLIVIPVGIFGRIYAFARKIWSYLDRKKKGITEKSMLIMGTSPADDCDEKTYFVPEFIKCIFDEYERDADFWSDLTKFDSTNDHDDTTEFNVSIIVNQALVVIFAHELAHVTLRHINFIRDVVNGMDLDDRVRSLLRTGMELEADFSSGVQLMAVWRMWAGAESHFMDQDRHADFFRMGFSLYLLLSIFDSKKRSLYAYDQMTYAHPLVRHQAIRTGARHNLTREANSLLPIWTQGSIAGWFLAEQSVNFFTVLELMPTISPQPEGAKVTPLIPVHAMNHAGEISMGYISDKIRKEQQICEATTSLREKYLRGTLLREDCEQIAAITAHSAVSSL